MQWVRCGDDSVLLACSIPALRETHSITRMRTLPIVRASTLRGRRRRQIGRGPYFCAPQCLVFARRERCSLAHVPNAHGAHTLASVSAVTRAWGTRPDVTQAG